MLLGSCRPHYLQCSSSTSPVVGSTAPRLAVQRSHDPLTHLGRLLTFTAGWVFLVEPTVAPPCHPRTPPILVTLTGYGAITAVLVASAGPIQKVALVTFWRAGARLKLSRRERGKKRARAPKSDVHTREETSGCQEHWSAMTQPSVVTRGLCVE
ncbi:hypothetical protein NDU88_001266 [Pleurodeles waltl]|uniref:Uncharacterized protein n=1 Tax=Pleurodeles waltl TaxID=8319 RepID=A0AAV7NBX4_PLEWA|nr:hypothetical protein NDU88_001266 [Pleurodeles waltl]